MFFAGIASRGMICVARLRLFSGGILAGFGLFPVIWRQIRSWREDHIYISGIFRL
jgi:hypothetical protein